MPKSIPPPTPVLNRLRAAAALLPIIEAGLAESKITVEKACSMAEFCISAVSLTPENGEEQQLAKTVVTGLQRLKATLPGGL